MKYELDATNESLGRVASRVAVLLRGKAKASYTPNDIVGDVVVVKNLKNAKFTGSKMDKKKFHTYSGYHSGIKTRSLKELWESKPTDVFRQMVYTMLPTNRSRDKIIKNLRFK